MFNTFYEAWEFLSNHRIYKDKGGRVSHFKHSCLDIDVAKVNPNTGEIDDNKELNTKVEIWLESGKYEPEYKQGCHDYDLDCGGDSFEEAIIELANLVYKKYGK